MDQQQSRTIILIHPVSKAQPYPGDYAMTLSHPPGGTASFPQGTHQQTTSIALHPQPCPSAAIMGCDMRVTMGQNKAGTFP
mmetsp:Transcript_3239/g.7193  ORF Transcript_3239/g.7193 Transcript_3239/m.7193 type:complete len:81 (+) Transcript_3239:416-658(+)